MATTDREMSEAEARMEAQLAHGFAVAARYDRRAARVVIELNTGLHLSFPTRLA